jgi:hypothetical protein
MSPPSSHELPAEFDREGHYRELLDEVGTADLNAFAVG